MTFPAFPANEQQRLDGLSSLDILDTPPEIRFDRITRIVSRHFKVPVALISMVAAKRLWLKSAHGQAHGLDDIKISREISFCGHTIPGDDIFYLPDTLKDPRFRDNPLVTGPPKIRFYAGAPLHCPNRMKVGALCIIDYRPRRFSKEQLSVLGDLANWVGTELERKHFKQAEKNQAHFAALVDSSDDAIISKTLDGIITSWNASAERIFGYTAEEIIGKPMSTVIPMEYASEEQDILRQIRNGRRIDHFETIRLRKNGDLIDVSATISPIKDNNNKIIGVSKIARDITERKLMEKMKAEFVSTVSHELRTPLTSIKGSLGLVKSGAVGKLPDKVETMIDIAYNNSDRLIRLINDILDVEKISTDEMKIRMDPVQLVSLLEQSIVANKGYGEQYNVNFVLSGSLVQATVNGDNDRLMQVMANLMSNAAKFSPKGGQVEISMSRKGDGFRVSVADKGIGIPDEFRDKIFQRFAQADSSDTRQKGGTGLGLNISREIIEKHGGRIGFDSQSGKGATFYFDLPELVKQPCSYRDY